jgi:phosphoribosylformylglycinamidine synthase PurS subunit
MKYEVRVQLKKDVLNVEAKEVLSAVKSQGFSSISSIQTAKLFILEVEGDESEAFASVTNVAKNILANEVIENFYITKVNES